MKEKVIVSWSGGKDSALALYELQKSCEIVALMTTITRDYDRISMHGTRRTLLELQAKSLGFPLEKVFISKSVSNEQYESKMLNVLTRYLADGVRSVVFGDIFLENLREYRENNLSRIGMKAIFPIWRKDTGQLAQTFIDLGFKAVITCVDSDFLDKEFVARFFDEQFLSDLPPSVDPCGENGEFHSFVFDGPLLQNRVSHAIGQVVLRESRFYYCDLIPLQESKTVAGPVMQQARLFND